MILSFIRAIISNIIYDRWCVDEICLIGIGNEISLVLAVVLSL